MAFTATQMINSGGVTSVFGRRLKLDRLNFLIGGPGYREPIEDLTTVATTLAHGAISRISGLLSSQGPVQHNLPNPALAIGQRKVIIMDCTSTGSQQFLSTPNGAAIFASSLGTTVGVINFIGPGGRIVLRAVSSAAWSVESEGPYISTAFGKNLTYTTST